MPVRARIKSVTLRITRGMAVYKYAVDAPLPNLNEALQTEKSRTWTTVTEEKDKGSSFN